MSVTFDRKAVVAGTIAGAAAVALVAKIVIRRHRFKVACGCLLTCTCNEKKKSGITSFTAETTRVTSAPASQEAPVEDCCSVAPASAAEVVLVEVAAQKQPPRSPTAGTKQPLTLTLTLLTVTLTLTLPLTISPAPTLTQPGKQQPAFEQDAPTAEAGRTRPATAAAVSPVSFAATAAALATAAAEPSSTPAAVGTAPLAATDTTDSTAGGAPAAPMDAPPVAAVYAALATPGTSVATEAPTPDTADTPFSLKERRVLVHRANKAAIRTADAREIARAQARADSNTDPDPGRTLP
jgi:hypothetical protein